MVSLVRAFILLRLIIIVLLTLIIGFLLILIVVILLTLIIDFLFLNCIPVFILFFSIFNV